MGTENLSEHKIWLYPALPSSKKRAKVGFMISWYKKEYMLYVKTIMGREKKII